MNPADSSAHVVVSGPRERSITVTDALLLFFAVVASVVIVILVLRLTVLFTPFRVAALAALFTFLILRAGGVAQIVRDTRLSWWLLGAVTAGLFLAGQLAPHYAAGQDQGFYTAMAEMLARGEPISFVDRFRESLPVDLRQIYDAMTVWAIEERPGGRQVIQFYSLHPALMAIATQVLGQGYHTAFMLLCFALSIIVIYLITFEITHGSRKLAGLAAWLVALNPAYVFFAKFPVTEITAATLAALFCYFLLIGFRARSGRTMLLNGFIAVLFMNAFCFTRMSFPEIAPFLMVLSAVLFFVPGVGLGRSLFVLSCVVLSFGCYALSMVYYHAVMPELFWSIVKLIYLPGLWRGRWLIAIGLGGGLIVLAALAWSRTRATALTAIAHVLRLGERIVLAYPGWLLLLLALPSIVFLVRTGTLEVFNPGEPRPGVAMIRFSAIYVLMLFVSPFVFLLLFAGMRPVAEGDRARLLPALVLVTVWPIYMTFASSVPYLYYYGRYLLPEVLPAAIVAAVLALDSSRLPKRLTVTLFAAALAYSGYFSLAQLRHAEGEVGRPFHQVAAHLAPGDVIVVDGAEFKEGTRSQLVIPLRYALGISTFILPPGTIETATPIFDRVRAVARGRVYFLTYSHARDLPTWLSAGFEKIEWIPFDAASLRMGDDTSRWRGWLLPYRITRGSGSPYALLRVPERISVPPLFGRKVGMSEKGDGHRLIREGWSVQDPGSRWTVGHEARLVFADIPERLKGTDLRFSLRASAFQQQRVEVVAGGAVLGERRMSSALEDLSFEVPASAVRDNQLEVILRLPDAHSPQSIGMDADRRLLGLAVLWVQLEAKQ
jgi:hypothetical protein